MAGTGKRAESIRLLCRKCRLKKGGKIAQHSSVSS